MQSIPNQKITTFICWEGLDRYQAVYVEIGESVLNLSEWASLLCVVSHLPFFSISLFSFSFLKVFEKEQKGVK